MKSSKWNAYVQDNESCVRVSLLPAIGDRAEHLEAADPAQTHQKPVDVHDVLAVLFHSQDPEE